MEKRNNRKGICKICKGPNTRNHTYCTDCGRVKNKEWRDKNKERHNERRRKKRIESEYGITWKEYKEILENQEGTCAICDNTETSKWVKGTEIKEKRMAIDHCHKTNKIRGILCSRCNTALGLFKDDTELLKKAINYLGGNYE